MPRDIKYVVNRKGELKVKLPKPKKGFLSQYGYHDIKHLSKRQRRHALKKAITEHGHLSIIRHLVLVMNYMRHNDSHHEAFEKLQEDQKWLSKNYKEYKEHGHLGTK